MATKTEQHYTFWQSGLPFWDQVKEVWTHGLFGVDIGSIIIALLIFGCFLVMREFLAKFILKRIETWAERTANKIDDRIIPCLIPPIKFIPIILGVFAAGQYLDFSPDIDIFFGKVVRTMISFTIFWALYLAAEPLGHTLKSLERLLTPMMTQWIFKVLKIIILFIGGATILEIWGIEVAPLLAGLGLFGAAIALGAQNFFQNLIAGMSIITEKRFQPGDWILVESVVEGTVEEIGFRSTKIRRFDKAPIYVPNSKLSDAVVTNFSRMTYRRIKWVIGLSYKTTVKQLKQAREEIMAYLDENADLFAPKEEITPTVRVDAFNDSSIDMMITCFTRTIEFSEWMQIKEDLAFKIKEIVEEKVKASFAFPSTSIYIENMPSDRAEIFIPPDQKKPGEKQNG